MPLAAPVTSAVNPFTERLICLNSAMGVHLRKTRHTGLAAFA
jgi:hypothetical protein